MSDTSALVLPRSDCRWRWKLASTERYSVLSRVLQKVWLNNNVVILKDSYARVLSGLVIRGKIDFWLGASWAFHHKFSWSKPLDLRKATSHEHLKDTPLAYKMQEASIAFLKRNQSALTWEYTGLTDRNILRGVWVGEICESVHEIVCRYFRFEVEKAEMIKKIK